MKHLLLAIVLSFSAQVARFAPLGAEVQSWHYDPIKGITTITIVNASHKDISAYSVMVMVFYADGTSNVTERTEDLLPGIISTSVAGHSLTADGGNGAFAPGATRDLTSPDSKPMQNIQATIQVVAYADGTADVRNEESFKKIVAQRKGTVLGLQKANELLTSALADPAEHHPSAAVATELQRLTDILPARKLARDNPEAHEGLGLLAARTQIEHAPQSPAGRTAAEEDYLRALIKDHERRISATLPHTQLTKAVQP
jgi:hypothetical protein